MPLYLNDFIDILADICKEKKIQHTVTSCAKGAAITGAFSGIGGLLLGPVGLVVGGALGGIVAGSTSSKFTPVPVILKNMSMAEKQKLCDKVVHAFRDFGLYDIGEIAAVVLSQSLMKNIAIEEVTNYLTKEMGLQICR